ncbi:hypothetical protein EVJ58_g10623 [Rhodofomes roseus]|uniref:Uncharacterized protein n=1 Tax=Rhodofomes roseus TaxID=34475 RepID=A0A4Y9XMM1_9APHY|nr:hypothetical protein EVJ58_g10623 [Rhodofomes roseus]
MRKNTINPVRDGIPRETYEVSHHVDNQDLKIQVLYEFEGANGGVVKVYGPFETCFYQRHNGQNEALIFPQHPSRMHGVFGLNFFQSMYISLHKSSDGINFVRMAAQWPENFEADLQDYNVPGLSAT